ncbi:MAG: hypothetical protein AAF226_06490, partial [Verrucomicrobiota bacterium]
YIVDQQQELAHLSDGVLYLMFEFVVDAIRKFMTYSEHLERDYEPRSSSIPDFRRHPDAKEAYFAALERLRGHVAATKHQIRLIAGEDPQKVPKNLQFHGWDADSYSGAPNETTNAEPQR